MNKKIIQALKALKNTKWAGTTRHDSLDKCLTAINLQSSNPGLYVPKGIRIPGLAGIFMLNEDGSVFFDARIIKEDKESYLIEYLTPSGFRDFENFYNKIK